MSVMNEIHKALSSLGPIIATSVFSLKVTDKKELCPPAPQESEGRPSDDHSRSHEVASTFIKEEDTDEESLSPADGGSPGRMSGVRPFVSPRGFDFPSIDSEASLGDPFEAGGESGTISGFGMMNRITKAERSEKCPEKSGPFIALSGNALVHVLEQAEKCVESKIKMGPQSHHVLEEEAAPHGNAFSSSSHLSLHPGTDELGRDREIFGNQSDFMSQEVFTCQQNTPLYWGQHGSNEYATNTIERGTFTRHQRTRTSGRLHQCTECEKTFSQKADVLRHQRTHTGERPYQCPECEKSFSQKSNLSRHQLTHTGDRLYKCTLCEKSFSQKVNLIVHKRTHTNYPNGS